MADTTQNTITSDNLQSQSPMVVPTPKPDQTPYESIIKGAITSLPNITGTIDQTTADQKRLTDALTTLGDSTVNKEAFSQYQQELAGVNTKKAELDKYNSQLTDLNAQISGLVNEKSAIPLRVQDNALGTGATDIGVAPEEAGMLRKNAIKALTLSSAADIIGANITNAERRLTRAKENAQLAVDLKYKPIEASIENIKNILETNSKYILDPAEKKRAEAVTNALNERTRLLNEEKDREKTVSDMFITAQAGGAPADVIARATALKDKGASISDITLSLGKYAGDYQKSALLAEQIKTEKLQQDKLALENKKTRTELGGAGSPVEKQKQTILTLNDTVKLVDDLASSGGLSGVVGPSGFARLNPIAGFTGESQNFIAGVQQLTNQQTLNKLLDLKKAGGTLGALNESEGAMLRDSATKINNWAIKDKDGKVTGYNVDEKSFKDELDQIRMLTNRAIVSAGGTEVAKPNKFNMALGKPATNSGQFQGTSILAGQNADGTFKFTIPVNNTNKK